MKPYCTTRNFEHLYDCWESIKMYAFELLPLKRVRHKYNGFKLKKRISFLIYYYKLILTIMINRRWNRRCRDGFWYKLCSFYEKWRKALVVKNYTVQYYLSTYLCITLLFFYWNVLLHCQNNYSRNWHLKMFRNYHTKIIRCLNRFSSLSMTSLSNSTKP